MLADKREARVIEGIFSQSVPSTNYALFSQALTARLPVPGDVPWERIFDLRSSSFLQDFRKKLAELDRLVKEDPDGRPLRELLDEMERRDLRELARTVEPDRTSAWAKAVTSNLPLPMPLNPLSLVASATDLIETYDRKTRFGWLYFLFELNEAA
jgi:hypothetical protein